MLLALLAFIWLIPIVWLLVTSFSSYKGINTMHFFPQRWSLDNYCRCFSGRYQVANFPACFMEFPELWSTDLCNFPYSFV